MDLGIKGKTALVTAAGRGLGKSISECLAQEGARLVITARTASDLEQVIESIGGKQKGHLALPLDLTESDGPKKLIDFLIFNKAMPDMMVHNLGGNLELTDPLCTLEEWRQVLRMNVEIPIELNRFFIPSMQKKGWGRICHVSSISALENHGPPSYCAAKAALTAYTRSLGRFVAPDGVIMNTVLPGAVFTEGGYWDKAGQERPHHVEKFLKERMAIKRFGKVEEIGKVVAFMCSKWASFCVGSSFVVDGGQGRLFYAQE